MESDMLIMILHRQSLQQDVSIQLYSTTSKSLKVHRQVLLTNNFCSPRCEWQLTISKTRISLLGMILDYGLPQSAFDHDHIMGSTWRSCAIKNMSDRDHITPIGRCTNEVYNRYHGMRCCSISATINCWWQQLSPIPWYRVRRVEVIGWESRATGVRFRVRDRFKGYG